MSFDMESVLEAMAHEPPAIIVRTLRIAGGMDAEIERVLLKYAGTHRIVSLQLPEPGHAGPMVARVVWERR